MAKTIQTLLNTALFAGFIGLTSAPVFAQNVGIGTATPLEKLHVIGNIRSSTLAGVGNRVVLADPNGTLIPATAATSPSWLVTGNSGLVGGNTTTAGTNFLGPPMHKISVSVPTISNAADLVPLANSSLVPSTPLSPAT